MTEPRVYKTEGRSRRLALLGAAAEAGVSRISSTAICAPEHQPDDENCGCYA